jgi:hypothetical protein
MNVTMGWSLTNRRIGFSDIATSHVSVILLIPFSIRATETR